MGILSPIGNGPDEALAAFRGGRSGIEFIPEWDEIPGLRTRVGGRVRGADEHEIDRKHRRTMGRVALLAALATKSAIADAGLTVEQLQAGRFGIAYASSNGSSTKMTEYFRHVQAHGLAGMRPFAYLQVMPHTCAINLAILLGAKGRIIAPCSACTSGSQSIGYAAEAIQAGAEDVMIAGGAEELDYTDAAVFDILFATSVKYHDAPSSTPRPFDRDRDGLVVAEGAGTLVLEEYEHARARGARIWAEILGFATNCDGRDVTNPSPDGMAAAMRLGLDDAGLSPGDIQYINAHATATEVGDVAEVAATRAVFGDRVPVSSTKSFTGHTLGGCGAIESAFAIWAMHWGCMPPTLNLDHVDPRCEGIDHVREVREAAFDTVMNNNFAFGGINTSLIFRRLHE